jgi:predicted nuclease with TOPRIM domain
VTPTTTDLQKLLAGERQTMMYPERLQEIKRRTGNSATESYQLADEALTLLSERDTLAARVIELEAENGRLREGLGKAESEQCASCRHCDSFGFRAALKGGEI